MKKKIFIVDDDRAIHNLIMSVLSPDDFEIIQAFNGHGIVEQIEREQPDLVLLDILMPVGDGRDICDAIKKNPETKDIKVIILSSKDKHHERILGFELGADEYVTKPFIAQLLANKIKVMCGIKLCEEV